jgi:hypothetical protein
MNFNKKTVEAKKKVQVEKDAGGQGCSKDI